MNDAFTIRLANWDKYQQYKHRNPTWVKLHHSILTSQGWIEGDGEQKALMCALLLLAARFNNCIPAAYTLHRCSVGAAMMQRDSRSDAAMMQRIRNLQRCGFLQIEDNTDKVFATEKSRVEKSRVEKTKPLSSLRSEDELFPIQDGEESTDSSQDQGKGNGLSSPSKKKKEKPAADPRFKPFMDILSRYWRAKNAIPFAFDASDGKALKLLLAAIPQLRAEQFAACLDHRANSEGVTHGERPRSWLANITKYANGPLNQYGRTAGGAA